MFQINRYLSWKADSNLCGYRTGLSSDQLSEVYSMKYYIKIKGRKKIRGKEDFYGQIRLENYFKVKQIPLQ